MTGTAVEDEGLDITEIVAFDVAKVTGTGDPANGFPLLMLKAAASAADGAGSPAGCGCCPDCTCPPAAKSVAEPVIEGDWSYPAEGDGELAKAARVFTADDRRKNAEAGNALPDGSYPIPDADALRRAAILARSGHGKWKAARRLISRRAKELGVPNPLRKKPKGGAAKSTLATEGTAVNNATSDGLAKTVGDAVTKANEPLIKRIADLEKASKAQAAELAKVSGTPQPGGPVMSAVPPQGARGAGKDYWLAKEAEYRQRAGELTADPGAAESYRQLARQAAEKARTGEPAP